MASKFKIKENRNVDWSKIGNIIEHILGTVLSKKDMLAKGGNVVEHPVIRNKNFPEPTDILQMVPDFGMILLLLSMCTYKLESVQLLGQLVCRNWTVRGSLLYSWVKVIVLSCYLMTSSMQWYVSLILPMLANFIFLTCFLVLFLFDWVDLLCSGMSQNSPTLADFTLVSFV